jgi:NodT family efflux transporter outer membrane factor (OMF) lipoprotein
VKQSAKTPLFKLAASLCIGTLFFDGCAVGPKFATPEAPVPAAWSAQKDPRVIVQEQINSAWWKGFNDPVLEHLIDLAYHQNLPLQIAGLRIVEARAQLGIATGAQFPQVLEATAQGAAIGFGKNDITAGDDRRFLHLSAGFDATWEMDFWGKYRHAVDAQAAALLSSEADYNSGIVSLTAEVARTYVSVRTFEVLIAQTQTNVKIQEESLQIAQARFKNGATSELDVAQAQTQFEGTRATIPQLQISLQQARNALSTLLGQPPGGIEALLAGPPEIPKPPEKVALSVPAEMLRRRPDIRSAELAAAAQCARVGAATAELYPSFSLFGSIGTDALHSSAVKVNLFSPASFFYAVGPQISWPFFTFGRTRNAIRVEDARLQELLINYRDTVLRADQEVENALTGYLNAHEAATFQQASVAAAQRAVELALVQYREGATDFQRVLDAQRALLTQQTNFAQTISSVDTYFISIFKALGGGWELRQGQPLIPEQTQKEMQERTNWGDVLTEPSAPETKTEPVPAKP